MAFKQKSTAIPTAYRTFSGIVNSCDAKFKECLTATNQPQNNAGKRRGEDEDLTMGGVVPLRGRQVTSRKGGGKWGTGGCGSIGEVRGASKSAAQVARWQDQVHRQ